VLGNGHKDDKNISMSPIVCAEQMTTYLAPVTSLQAGDTHAPFEVGEIVRINPAYIDNLPSIRERHLDAEILKVNINTNIVKKVYQSARFESGWGVDLDTATGIDSEWLVK